MNIRVEITIEQPFKHQIHILEEVEHVQNVARLNLLVKDAVTRALAAERAA
jgi:hypothetical protein